MTGLEKCNHQIHDSIANTSLARKVGAAVIAHRGVHGVNSATENSLSALELAIRFGVAAEIDIFFTATGQSVLLHGPVSKWAAHRTIHTLQNQATLCRLETALDLVSGQVPLLLDLKHLSLASPDAIIQFVNLLTTYAGPLFIASFDPNVLALKSSLPGIPVGLITFGLNFNMRQYHNYDFLDVQKDFYHLRRSGYDSQQLKFLWTYSSLHKAAEATRGTPYIGVCNISEQAAMSWGL